MEILDLQFFAEAGEGGNAGAPAADAGNAGESGADKGNGGGEGMPAGAEKPAKPADLNALLKGDKGLQSQFDKLVAKAQETAKAKWQQEQAMTAEQLAAARMAEQESALAQREKELARRELRATALGTLSEKGLPTALIDCVALDSEESMQATLDSTEKAFRNSLDAAVKDKLKGGAPKAGGGGTDAYETQMMKALGLK